MREPSVVIKETIDIINELISNATNVLSKVNEMTPDEREALGLNYIISTRLNLHNNCKLIEELKIVSDLATVQYTQIISEILEETMKEAGASSGNLEV